MRINSLDKMFTQIKVTLVIGLLVGVANSSWAATSIGTSFIGRGSDQPLSPSDSAGVVPQIHWNNIPDDGTYKGKAGNLIDSAGNFTAVTLIFEGSDSWNSDGPTVTPNDKMMKGILKANPSPNGCDTAGAPTNNTDRILLVISNLVATATYNVIIYACENGTGAVMTVTLGTTLYYISETNSFDGTFLRSTDTLGVRPNANYVQFDGVMPAGDGTITVTCTKQIDCDGTTQFNDGIGVPGVQIVQTAGAAFPPNTLTCSITSSPSSTNVIIGFPVTFTVGTTGPHATQWRTNGVDIAGAVNDSYSIAAVTAADNGVVYMAVVYNNVNTNSSTPATLSTHTNDVPVAITFNPSDTLAVEGGTASFSVGATGNFIKYQWQKNNANILDATNANYTTPATVYPGDNGTTYRCIVYNNVNTNTSTSATLTVDQNVPPHLTQGFLKVEQWQNINGTAVSTLITAINGGPPTTSFFVAGANVPQTSPNLENFGDKASGWLSPDVTGDYYFFIRSDDSSQLFLNSTAAVSGTNTLPNINTDTPICKEDACCNGFMETNDVTPPSQTTATPIHLEAGKLYGAVILLKEGGGNDYVQVAWRLASDTTRAASLKPIGSGNCWTLATPAGQRASITRQPTSISTTEDRPASFVVGVNTSPVAGLFGAKWFSNNVAIPGGTSPRFTIPVTTLADNGKTFQAIVYTLAGSLTSSVANLTVVADTFPPVPLVGTIKRNDGAIQVGVGFDEPVNQSDIVAANFSLIGGTSSTLNFQTNSYGDYKGVLFDTTGLVVGNTYTVHVANVRDSRGNAISAAGTNVPFTVGNRMGWADTGSPIRPGQVVPVGSDGFDVLNGGRQEWDVYDEATIAYVKKTNNFDVKLQVVYAEPGSEWTRVGLVARNDLNVGEPSSDHTAGGASAGSAYAQTHVNPNQTLASSGRFAGFAAPTLTSAASGGTVADGTYNVKFTYALAGSQESVPSSTGTISITNPVAGTPSSTITIASPPASAGSVGWYAYSDDGAGSASYFRQQPTNTPTAIGTALVLTAPPVQTNGTLVLPVNPTPNNGHEQNQRLARGSTSNGWGNPATSPVYPFVWLRLQRQGTTLHGYRSEDGVDWDDQGTITLTDQQPDMFVGPFLAVETGNIWAGGDFDVWNAPFDAKYDRLFVAQFRNFGDTFPPTVSISKSGANISVTFTGTLLSSTSLSGPWTTVATTSPYLTTATGSARFFRSQ